jgi:starvation-inducible DNA-binding protein
MPMRESNSELPIESARPACTTANHGDFGSRAELLEELLGHSIKLRDLYKSARWQTTDIRLRSLRFLFDDHYKEQLRLVDVLLDRLRILGGGGCAMASLLVRDTPCSSPLCGRASPIRLLDALLEAHDAVLIAARAVANSDEWVAAVSNTDFAVGQVVLVNKTQFQSVNDQLIARSNGKRIIAAR